MSFSISNVELSRSLIGPSEALTVSFDLTHNMSKRLANLSMYIRYASTVYYVVKQVQIPANQARNTTVHYIVDVNTCGSSESGSVFAEMISGNYRRYTDSLTFMWRAFDEAGSYYDYVSASIPGNILIDRRCVPVVETLQLERAANGVPDDEGENLMATIKLSVADSTWLSGMSCWLHYAQGSTVDDTAPHIDLTSSLSDLLAGVSGDATLIAQTFARNSDWAFLLVFGDVETGQGLCEVSRAFANLHLSGASTGGAAFGRFSTSSGGDPKLESEYPLYAYAGIEGVNNYSTAEVLTGGHWIDGKPLYHKVLHVTTKDTIDLSDLDFDFIRWELAYKFTFGSSAAIQWSSTYYYSSSDYAMLYVNGTNLIVRMCSNIHLIDCYIFLEYTKTTD